QAANISGLFWLFFAVSVGVYVLCVVLVVIPSAPRTETESDREEGVSIRRDKDSIYGWWVGIGIALTTVVLFVLLGADFMSGEKLHAEASENPLKVKVTGHQWWWEVEYEDPTPSNTFHTANEIHLPIGKP